MKSIEIRARVKDIVGEYPVIMNGDPGGDPPPIGELQIRLPLVTFIHPILQIQITKTFRSGEVAVKPWLDWDIESYGYSSKYNVGLRYRSYSIAGCWNLDSDLSLTIIYLP